MRPILLQGHERSLTQVVFNPDGDLLFSTSKDHVVNVWFSHNGERLGTYNGHIGAVWTVHVNPTSTLLATGSADNTMKLWNVQDGTCLHTWDFHTAVKRVEFSEDGSMLLGVTEQRMGHTGTVTVFSINEDGQRTTGIGFGKLIIEAKDPIAEIPTQESKATVAGWSFLDKYIIMGHENGTVSQWDWKSGKMIKSVQGHQKGMLVTDLQFSPDRTYFITASKDKSAKIWDANTLDLLKTYVSDTPLNTAAITPVKDFVILGGGQEARDVTTTQARQGKFEARFYHKIFEDEVGRVRGHFGPLNTIAVHPKGTCYASGGEDGYVRVHHFEPGYFDFMYEVERERQRASL